MAGKQGNIFMGNLNYLNIDWANGTAQSMACNFFNVLQDDFTGKKNDPLYTIISNNTKFITDMQVRDNLGNRDHGEAYLYDKNSKYAKS